MRRRGLFFMIGGLLLASLAVAFFWHSRLDLPSPRPWWYGKNPVVHVEIWEAGRDEATVVVNLPKSVLDTFQVFGFPAGVSYKSMDADGRVEFREIWHELQRLPRGKRLEVREGGDRVYVSIDLAEARR